MSEDDKKPGAEYVIPVGPAAPDSSFPAVRLSGNSASLEVIVPVKDGQPLGDGELLHLEPIEGSAAFSAKVVYGGRHGGRPGPAMVNSPSFRSGWDAVFGKPTEGTSALN